MTPVERTCMRMSQFIAARSQLETEQGQAGIGLLKLSRWRDGTDDSRYQLRWATAGMHAVRAGFGSGFDIVYSI